MGREVKEDEGVGEKKKTALFYNGPTHKMNFDNM
jgi:hypothetical protein